MKKFYVNLALLASTASLLLTGCKNNGSVWDDTRSATTFNGKDGRTLWGNVGESDFASEDLIGPADEDFIPLQDEDLKAAFADGAIPQPKHSPGEDGSGLPSIEKFFAPSTQLAGIFRTVYFNTDDHVLRGKDYLGTIDKIASYLKEHPNTYVFVAGHCDERGPEAYNLSLGSRRANYVRTLLVQKGVDLNQLHTISYGKEQPAIKGIGQDAWSKNRRAEFKIYQK
jgi:peptidoglycan-associated lipoprotein